MSTQAFSPVQRDAIWNAYARKCFFGKEPLELKDVEIDHLVPEELLNSPDRMAKVLKEYGLDSSFDLRGYRNLVPTCHDCNGLKSNRQIHPDKMVLYLGFTQSKADEIKKAVALKSKGQALGAVLSTIIQSIDRGRFTGTDLESALRDANIIELQMSVDLRPPPPPIEVRISRRAEETSLREPEDFESILNSLRSGAAGAQVHQIRNMKLYIVRLTNGMRLAFSQEENVVTILAMLRPGDTAESILAIGRGTDPL